MAGTGFIAGPFCGNVWRNTARLLEGQVALRRRPRGQASRGPTVAYRAGPIAQDSTCAQASLHGLLLPPVVSNQPSSRREMAHVHRASSQSPGASSQPQAQLPAPVAQLPAPGFIHFSTTAFQPDPLAFRLVWPAESMHPCSGLQGSLLLHFQLVSGFLWARLIFPET